MCIIAVKPANVKMPDEQTIQYMWTHNPDGAGFMYAKDGLVHISKGYMKLKSFKQALIDLSSKVDLTTTPVVMHFRIATHGGVSPSNTHPFAVTESLGILQKLQSTCTLGVAHNGIIYNVTPRKGISDTMEYILSQLGPLYNGVPDFLTNPHLMDMVSNAIESKMAFLTGEGNLYTIGSFTQDKATGISYSNDSYKYRPPVYTLPSYASGSYNLDDDDWSYSSWDDWKSIDTSLAFKQKLVRYLWEEDGEFVKNEKGELESGADYAVDEYGKVYKYNHVFGCLVPAHGYTAIYDGLPFDDGDPKVYYEDVMEAD